MCSVTISLVPQMSISTEQVAITSRTEQKNHVAVPERDLAFLVWPQGCDLPGDKVSQHHHPHQCCPGDKSSPACLGGAGKPFKMSSFPSEGTKGDTNSSQLRVHPAFRTHHAGTSDRLLRSSHVPLQLSGGCAGVFPCRSHVSTRGMSNTIQTSQ